MSASDGGDGRSAKGGALVALDSKLTETAATLELLRTFAQWYASVSSIALLSFAGGVAMIRQDGRRSAACPPPLQPLVRLFALSSGLAQVSERVIRECTR